MNTPGSRDGYYGEPTSTYPSHVSSNQYQTYGSYPPQQIGYYDQPRQGQSSNVIQQPQGQSSYPVGRDPRPQISHHGSNIANFGGLAEIGPYNPCLPTYDYKDKPKAVTGTKSISHKARVSTPGPSAKPAKVEAPPSESPIEIVTGIVTQLQDTFGMVSSEIYFDISTVVGSAVNLGDTVVVEAVRVRGMPFKLNAKKIQTVSKDLTGGRSQFQTSGFNYFPVQSSSSNLTQAIVKPPLAISSSLTKAPSLPILSKSKPSRIEDEKYRPESPIGFDEASFYLECKNKFPDLQVPEKLKAILPDLFDETEEKPSKLKSKEKGMELASTEKKRPKQASTSQTKKSRSPKNKESKSRRSSSPKTTKPHQSAGSLTEKLYSTIRKSQSSDQSTRASSRSPVRSSKARRRSRSPLKISIYIRSRSPSEMGRNRRSRSPLELVRKQRARSPLEISRHRRSRSPLELVRRQRARSPLEISRYRRSRSPLELVLNQRARSPLEITRYKRSRSPLELVRNRRSRSPLEVGRNRRSRSRSPVKIYRNRKSMSPMRIAPNRLSESVAHQPINAEPSPSPIYLTAEESWVHHNTINTTEYFSPYPCAYNEFDATTRFQAEMPMPFYNIPEPYDSRVSIYNPQQEERMMCSIGNSNKVRKLRAERARTLTYLGSEIPKIAPKIYTGGVSKSLRPTKSSVFQDVSKQLNLQKPTTVEPVNIKIEPVDIKVEPVDSNVSEPTDSYSLGKVRKKERQAINSECVKNGLPIITRRSFNRLHKTGISGVSPSVDF